MKFYKVVLNGTCQGQDIRNILYYRDGPGLTWTNLFWSGSEYLAQAIADSGLDKYLNFMPNDYTLESIDVYPHDENYVLTASQPFSMGMNAQGLNTGAHAGMTQCVNFKFQMEPTGIVNGVYPPKKGYIAMGPIPAAWVGEDGYIPNLTLDTPVFHDVENFLKGDLAILLPLPGSFFPIRVRRNSALLGAVQWTSWADVNGCKAQALVSSRRSRQPER